MFPFKINVILDLKQLKKKKYLDNVIKVESRPWAECRCVRLWPALGCWPGSTPGSGCCGPECGSGGTESPAGRWCTAGCIRPGCRRDWAAAGAASGTDPKFPKNSLLHRSPASLQLCPLTDRASAVSAWAFEMQLVRCQSLCESALTGTENKLRCRQSLEICDIYWIFFSFLKKTKRKTALYVEKCKVFLSLQI